MTSHGTFLDIIGGGQGERKRSGYVSGVRPRRKKRGREFNEKVLCRLLGLEPPIPEVRPLVGKDSINTPGL